MTYRLPPLGALRAFESAARHLSFKKAAEELHVTPAAISQQIKALEDFLGIALFDRLTRAVRLTEQATAMLPQVRAGFECLAAAVESSRQTQADILTVTAPPSFAMHWLVPRLPRFAERHPGIALRLASRADSVDRQSRPALPEESEVDLRDHASEVAIRYGTGVYPGYRVMQLFAPEYVPVCSPALFACGRLATPTDLREQVLIHDDTLDEGERPPGWAEWLRRHAIDGVDGRRGPRFSNAVLAMKAAIDGQGVVLALKPLIEAEIASGQLRVAFDLPLPSPYAYFLVVREALAQRAPVAAFQDWLLAESAGLR